jgi:hypothetical protein
MPEPTFVASSDAQTLRFGSPSPAPTGTPEATALERELARDVQLVAPLQQFSEVIPAADLVFGGAMLIVIVLVHATGVRAITNYVLRRSMLLMKAPARWKADVLMASTVFALLGLHLLEMFAWAAALVYSGLVSDWRSAGFFAGNTYTTIGYGTFVLPFAWRMLAPIIAISGLLTFGWSGSVIVDLLSRCQRIKDAAIARTA